MSGNSSASGGFLTPTSGPPDAAALDALLQASVVGITGLPGSLVRPRWQPEPPPQPPASTDWCAIGVTRRRPHDYPEVKFNSPAPGDTTFQGSATLWRSEDVEVMASFYGPNCQALAGVLRDGFYIAQNREALDAVGIKLTEVGETVAAPEIINMQWVGRADVTVRLVRMIGRDYNILYIRSASVLTVAG